MLPVNTTHPPQSDPGVNATHTYFHTIFAYELCFYGWRPTKMSSGHWHPPMNPRKTDPGPGIPGSHLVPSSTSDDKGEEACLCAFNEHTGMVDAQ